VARERLPKHRAITSEPEKPVETDRHHFVLPPRESATCLAPPSRENDAVSALLLDWHLCTRKGKAHRRGNTTVQGRLASFSAGTPFSH
jgi:hypothetical protein